VTPIRWSPQAVRDVEAIRNYIAQDSQRYAQLTVDRIITSSNAFGLSPSPVGWCQNAQTQTSEKSSWGPSAWSTGIGLASSTSLRCFEDRGCSRTSSRRRPNKVVGTDEGTSPICGSRSIVIPYPLTRFLVS
jgi:hypothetical protein